MTPIIETKHLAHTYSKGTPFEKNALSDVCFSALPGECVGIIGHTGSGKSTLMQHLNGLLKPTAGQVLFEGRDIHATKEVTRALRFAVGLVFQYPEYQLFDETVYKDIAFGPKNMGITGDALDYRVGKAAELVGLTGDLLEKSPFALSGGQKRRAAIAGVMAMEPKVLILDEPTAGLDPKGREEILANIETFRKNTGATIIFVTHSMEEIAKVADRIVVMQHGAIAMTGARADIFAQAERLTGMGLDVPEVTQIILALRKAGMDLPENALTVDDAVRMIRQKVGKGLC